MPTTKRRKIKFTDGVYVGEITKNQRHGQGTFTYQDGCVYVGAWAKNVREGQGIYTWPSESTEKNEEKSEEEKDIVKSKKNRRKPESADSDAADLSDKYVGEWKSDKKAGTGTFTWAKGRGKYTGEWKDNAFDGEGVCIWPDGRKYVGEWVSDQRHGRGLYLFEDGRYFEGEFENDWPKRGLLVERDGNSFLTTYTGRTLHSMWLSTTKKRVGTLEESRAEIGKIDKPDAEGEQEMVSKVSPAFIHESQTTPLPRCTFVWDNVNSIQYRRFEGTRIGLCPKEGVLIKNDGMFKVIYDGKTTFAENPTPISSVQCGIIHGSHSTGNMIHFAPCRR